MNDSDSILVLNAGSSSLKCSLFDARSERTRASGSVRRRGREGAAELVLEGGTRTVRRSVSASDMRQSFDAMIEAMIDENLIERGERSRLAAVAHRVVHGGSTFRHAVRIDQSVESEIERLSQLAPLHNPPALEVIRAATTAFPRAAQVAVFDTAFFADLPPRGHVFPLPYDWYEHWGVRRYGFHGISHAYCAERAAELLNQPRDRLCVVTCHLGNGCSAAAIRGGRPVATTMGFTPLDGLMMGTRPGSIDPGIVLYVARHHARTIEQIDDALQHGSGLLGVSGVSSDYREVETAAASGHARARLALELYADRVRGTIAALAVTLDRLDAIVFTAGVGENSAALRSAVCDGLGLLGVRLDSERNRASRGDGDVAAGDSPVRVLVIHTREDLMIARAVRAARFV